MINEEGLYNDYVTMLVKYPQETFKTDFSVDRFESFDDVYNSFIENLEEGLYTNDEKCFKLTREGFLVENQVILTLAMAI